MSFKDNYKEYEEKVVPNCDFLKKLGDDMNSDRRSNISIHSQRVITRVSASCACLAICAVALTIIIPKQISVSYKGGSESASPEMVKGMFSSESWYGDKTAPTEIYEAFTQKLDSDLSKLYESPDEKFTDNEIVSQDTAASIVSNLKNATESEISSERTNPMYYMAVMSDGSIIKFSVYNEQNVEIKGVDSFFEIQ